VADKKTLDKVKTAEISQPPAPVSAHDNHTQREKTIDEVKFDRRVYGGISYFAQAAVGIALTYWSKFGGGKEKFQAITEWVGPKIYKSLAAREGIQAAAKEVNTATATTLMILVGSLFLIPVKMIEKNKGKIVRGMYEKRVAKEEASGNIISPEEKARDEDLLQQLEKEPPQSWRSLIEARGASLVGVYAVLFAIGGPRNDALQKVSSDLGLKALDKVGLKTLAKSEPVARVFNLSFVDAFYSMISAGGLYIYSHFIRPPKDKQSKRAVPSDEPDLTTGTTVRELIAVEQETPAPHLFQDRIKPREKIVMPEALHAQKLAAEPDNVSIATGI
jgi:hypothetical protein